MIPIGNIRLGPRVRAPSVKTMIFRASALVLRGNQINIVGTNSDIYRYVLLPRAVALLAHLIAQGRVYFFQGICRVALEGDEEVDVGSAAISRALGEGAAWAD